MFLFHPGVGQKRGRVPRTVVAETHVGKVLLQLTHVLRDALLQALGAPGKIITRVA